jgi:hypothetical protein
VAIRSQYFNAVLLPQNIRYENDAKAPEHWRKQRVRRVYTLRTHRGMQKPPESGSLHHI